MLPSQKIIIPNVVKHKIQDALNQHKFDKQQLFVFFQKLFNNEKSAKIDLKLKEGSYLLFSARITLAHRGMFSLGKDAGEDALFLIDLVLDHDYQKCVYLNTRHALTQTMEKLSTLDDHVIITPNNLAEVLEVDDKSLTAHHPALDIRPLYICQGKVLEFDDKQLNATELPLPMVISGGPGTGKTVIAIQYMASLLSKLSSEEDEDKKIEILFIAKSKLLVNKVKEEINHFYVEKKKNIEVKAVTFHDFLCEKQAKLNTKARVNEINAIPWIKKNSAKILISEFSSTQALNPLLIYQEFCHASRFENEADYLASGKRESLFNDKSVRANIYALFSQYKKYLASQSQWDFSFSRHIQHEAEENKDHYIFVDESQDLSCGNLALLFDYAKGKIGYLLDTRQSLFHLNSPRPFLLTFAKNHINLSTCYRCPAGVILFLQNLINIRICLNQGMVDEYEQKFITHVDVNQHDAYDGLFLLNLDDFHAQLSYIKENYSGNCDFAIITAEEYIEEVKQLFINNVGNPTQIITPLEAKGLEYKIVLYYKPFNVENIKDINQFYKNQSLEKIYNYRTKSKKNNPFILTINTMLATAGRATESLIIIQDFDEHQFGPLFRATFPENLPRRLAGRLEKSSRADWESHIQILEEEGYAEQAQKIKIELDPQPIKTVLSSKKKGRKKNKRSVDIPTVDQAPVHDASQQTSLENTSGQNESPYDDTLTSTLAPTSTPQKITVEYKDAATVATRNLSATKKISEKEIRLEIIQIIGHAFQKYERLSGEHRLKIFYSNMLENIKKLSKKFTESNFNMDIFLSPLCKDEDSKEIKKLIPDPLKNIPLFHILSRFSEGREIILEILQNVPDAVHSIKAKDLFTFRKINEKFSCKNFDNLEKCAAYFLLFYNSGKTSNYNLSTSATGVRILHLIFDCPSFDIENITYQQIIAKKISFKIDENEIAKQAPLLSYFMDDIFKEALLLKILTQNPSIYLECRHEDLHSTFEFQVISKEQYIPPTNLYSLLCVNKIFSKIAYTIYEKNPELLNTFQHKHLFTAHEKQGKHGKSLFFKLLGHSNINNMQILQMMINNNKNFLVTIGHLLSKKEMDQETVMLYHYFFKSKNSISFLLNNPELLKHITLAGLMMIPKNKFQKQSVSAFLSLLEYDEGLVLLIQCLPMIYAEMRLNFENQVIDISYDKLLTNATLSSQPIYKLLTNSLLNPLIDRLFFNFPQLFSQIMCSVQTLDGNKVSLLGLFCHEKNYGHVFLSKYAELISRYIQINDLFNELSTFRSYLEYLIESTSGIDFLTVLIKTKDKNADRGDYYHRLSLIPHLLRDKTKIISTPTALALPITRWTIFKLFHVENGIKFLHYLLSTCLHERDFVIEEFLYLQTKDVPFIPWHLLTKSSSGYQLLHLFYEGFLNYKCSEDRNAEDAKTVLMMLTTNLLIILTTLSRLQKTIVAKDESSAEHYQLLPSDLNSQHFLNKRSEKNETVLKEENNDPDSDHESSTNIWNKSL